MGSPQLSAAQAGLAARAEDKAHAAQLQRLFPGWQVFTTRDGANHVATRIGDQPPPDGDGTWSKTIVGDDWPDLERQLAEQAAHDAAR